MLKPSMLRTLREQTAEARSARFRRLYPRDFDSASQLPPRRGHRRPQFCRPLRQVDIRVHRHKLVDATAWGFEKEPEETLMTPEPVTGLASDS